MISESLEAVCVVESLRHPCQQFVDHLWAVWTVVCVTRDSRSLMIYESLGAVWAVESLRLP